MGQLAKIIDVHLFENLCKDVLSIIYTENFSIFGRLGQNQYGIDLYSSTKVAQCKCYTDNKKESYTRLFNQLKKDYNTACKHFNFSDFIILTALNRDVTTQKNILDLSNPKYPISIYFWEDIEQIALDNYEILKLHFPYLTNASDMSNFSVNQAVFKSKIRDIFDKYNVYKLVHEPTIISPFDENCIYDSDDFECEVNDFFQNWGNSMNSISSTLVEKCLEFTQTLSYYYHFLSCHTIPNIPANGWTRPLNNSQEDMNTFIELRNCVIKLYNELVRLLR